MLADIAIRKAKPRDKAYKLSDGGGLYVEIFPNGSKLWRLKYRRADAKETRVALGAYPEVSAPMARAERVARSRHIPLVGRAVGEGYPSVETTNGIAPRGRPRSGRKSAPHSQYLRAGVPLCGGDWTGPARPGRGAAWRVGAGQNHSPRQSQTDPKAIGALLRAIDGYKGTLVSRCALQLAPLVFVRPGELRQAEWVEFNFEADEWRIPGEKMKMPVPGQTLSPHEQ